MDWTAKEIESVVGKYSDMLFRICFIMLCKEQDAEDAIQETFIRYILKAPVFAENEHLKAWLIKVATNICKDMLRFRLRHTHLNIDELSNYYSSDENVNILETVLTLPHKYKIAILLHYIEGYDILSISRITGKSVSAVKKHLQRGREMLKLEIQKGESC